MTRRNLFTAAVVVLVLALAAGVVVDTVEFVRLNHSLSGQIHESTASRVRARTQTCYLLRGLLISLAPPPTPGSHLHTSDSHIERVLDRSQLRDCDQYGRLGLKQ